MGRRMTAALCGLVLVLASTMIGGSSTDSSASPLPAAPTSASVPRPPSLVGEPVASCPVTLPNGDAAPEKDPFGGHGYGNGGLWTNVWMWGQGEVSVPPTHVMPDGAFGGMKWAWYRYAPGRLSIEGRRLDAPAPPLRADIPEGYGDEGFQVSGLIFPTGGCWEVTGKVGDVGLTFVTLVIPPE